MLRAERDPNGYENGFNVYDENNGIIGVIELNAIRENAVVPIYTPIGNKAYDGINLSQMEEIVALIRDFKKQVEAEKQQQENYFYWTEPYSREYNLHLYNGEHMGNLLWCSMGNLLWCSTTNRWQWYLSNTFGAYKTDPSKKYQSLVEAAEKEVQKKLAELEGKKQSPENLDQYEKISPKENKFEEKKHEWQVGDKVKIHRYNTTYPDSHIRRITDTRIIISYPGGYGDDTFTKEEMDQYATLLPAENKPVKKIVKLQKVAKSKKSVKRNSKVRKSRSPRKSY